MTASALLQRTIRDHFVTIAEPPAKLLQAVEGRLPYLERFAVWPDRADARFLMGLGEDLFRIAFAGDQAHGDFVQALADTVAADGTLRLWLHAQDPRLAMLPWEYLCLTAEAVEECRELGMSLAKHQPYTTLPEEATFLALHPQVSLVRQTNPTSPEPEIQRIGALRVLLGWADPGPLPDGSGWPPLSGLELEVDTIRQMLQSLPATHCEVRVLAHASREELTKQIREWKPHVLHLSCHGGIPGLDDPLDDLDAPSLVLERKPRSPKRPHAYLTAEELRSLCGEAGTQVVVLNACWGGRSQRRLAGIGHTLSTGARPVPVVVAQLTEAGHAALDDLHLAAVPGEGLGQQLGRETLLQARHRLRPHPAFAVLVGQHERFLATGLVGVHRVVVTQPFRIVVRRRVTQKGKQIHHGTIGPAQDEMADGRAPDSRRLPGGGRRWPHPHLAPVDVAGQAQPPVRQDGHGVEELPEPGQPALQLLAVVGVGARAGVAVEFVAIAHEIQAVPQQFRRGRAAPSGEIEQKADHPAGEGIGRRLVQQASEAIQNVVDPITGGGADEFAEESLLLGLTGGGGRQVFDEQ